MKIHRSSPIISIVTICFNNPHDLRYTLDSITGADPETIECLIMDGSTDSSCGAVAKDYPFAKYEHGKDGGKYDAMNKGLLKATGQGVIFINSGDRLIDVHRLNRIALDNHDIIPNTVVFGDHQVLIDGRIISRKAPPPTRDNLRVGLLPSHQATIIPRSFYKRVNYDSTMNVAADTKLMRLAFAELEHKYLGEAIAVFSHGGVSSMPGKWSGVLEHYKEYIASRDLTYIETVRIGLQLMTRKILRMVLGKTLLERIQAWKASITG